MQILEDLTFKNTFQTNKQYPHKMSSAVAPAVVAPSPTSESSSASSTATPNSNQPLSSGHLNDNYEANIIDSLTSPSFSILDNKENKDETNTINNNKVYGHSINSNNSSTTTIVGSNSASTIKGSTASTASITTADEAKRSCNRCQNCPGFSSHEWRNTCTSCRCPRSCHDISIGARCCGFHRAGFDQTSQQLQPLQTANSGSTMPVSSITSSLNHNVSTIQPPPPSGNAPSIETNLHSSSPTSLTKTNPSGVSCIRHATAEAAGYSWMPPVS